MLHVICTRLCLGHLNVHVGDNLRRCEIVKKSRIVLLNAIIIIIFKTESEKNTGRHQSGMFVSWLVGQVISMTQYGTQHPPHISSTSSSSLPHQGHHHPHQSPIPNHPQSTTHLIIIHSILLVRQHTHHYLIHNTPPTSSLAILSYPSGNTHLITTSSTNQHPPQYPFYPANGVTHTSSLPHPQHTTHLISNSILPMGQHTPHHYLIHKTPPTSSSILSCPGGNTHLITTSSATQHPPHH